MISGQTNVKGTDTAHFTTTIHNEGEQSKTQIGGGAGRLVPAAKSATQHTSTLLFLPPPISFTHGDNASTEYSVNGKKNFIDGTAN